MLDRGRQRKFTIPEADFVAAFFKQPQEPIVAADAPLLRRSIGASDGPVTGNCARPRRPRRARMEQVY